MGKDYYITNEHVIRDDGTTIGAGDVYGYYVITRQYFDRYRLPVMHTETNRTSNAAVEWLWKEWMNLLRLREDGVPIIGFTWYGLIDMKDWDTALTKAQGHVNKVGLYTVDRNERKVAREYRRLAKKNQLPTIPSGKGNPFGDDLLPLYFVRRHGWKFTATFANTALAHRLGADSPRDETD